MMIDELEWIIQDCLDRDGLTIAKFWEMYYEMPSCKPFMRAEGIYGMSYLDCMYQKYSCLYDKIIEMYPIRTERNDFRPLLTRHQPPS